ncbi:uncharacterized secreted protein with C-terminal beta-propeller domain [Ureibacillus xyleni]|uniref:Uncharacterized secreted protein with C-terminal beta-propeller domain n=1 Tax=Ureibacillus xyleni TaxID=614648 RepID=A0A285SRS0_9BACL|nr:beta-propeller domain-containing protein [Ureibacillus xyleni]SOC10990.1 uncharacterized secreted protein with C-terminal beta-propeller domain [Ureibacillus xyleni]
MKGRHYAGGIFLLVVILVASSLLFFGKKVEVNAASTVLVNQPYIVHLSQSLEKDSVKKGDIYVKNGKGQKVEASISLHENRQSLSIVNTKTGNYVLHVEKNAFEKSTTKTKTQKIEYTVIEKIEQLQSIKDLENFFKVALSREKRNIEKAETTMAEESSNVAADKASGEPNHSTTNNQVEDIEEGDIVVTDGRYIYSIIENEIVITDAKNPKSMKVAHKISLEKNSYPTQLMMKGNTLIVILDQYIEMKKKDYISSINMTKAAFYDVKDAHNPKLIREVAQDGYMNGVRLTNGILYIVTNKTPDYWIMAEREDVELRPYVYDSAESKSIKPMDIKQLSILPGSMEPSYTIISAIDVNNFEKSEVKTKGFLGGSSTLYMSKDALYLTAFNYLPATFESSKMISTDMAILPMASDTDIYKFDIDGTNVKLAGTTTIKGNLLNQFSMDEHNGYFRVAVTEGNNWGMVEQVSKNHLLIFNKKMEKVGEVRDLAKGEKIYSVRFMGDKAYIVTFKQVDPLFVIDLEQPENPKVLGELKIPGFSNYLHPLDENHLIGFGYETESRVDSFSKEPIVTTTGMKISLFDVSDFSNPKEQDTVTIGGRGTYSDIQYNHKALFRNAALNYYGFPVTIYEAKGDYEIAYKGTGALVYEITAEKGIQLKGNLIKNAQKGEQYEDYNSMITRLLYIDNTLYTISPKEVNSYDLQNFKALGNVKLK